MVIVDAVVNKIVDNVLNETNMFLNDLAVKKSKDTVENLSTLDDALKEMPYANLALFKLSIGMNLSILAKLNSIKNDFYN